MKKRINLLAILLTLTFVALLSLALVACNSNDGSTPSGGGGSDPEIASFTVTFDVDGAQIAYDAQTVQYDGKVTKPLDPVKTGYTFQYWQTTNTGTAVEWNFDTNTITQNTTLKALWQVNSYTHQVTSASLHDAEHPIGKVDENKGSYTYTSVYNAQKADWSVPTTKDGLMDTFVYWYYKDANDNEVRFTTWVGYTLQTSSNTYNSSNTYYARKADNTYVVAGQDGTEAATSANFSSGKYYTRNELKEAEIFTLTHSLTLYPKWRSQLDDETVKFYDGATQIGSDVTVKYNDTLKAPAEPTKVNYDFDGWYYAQKNGDSYVMESGAYVASDKKFDFDESANDTSFTLVTDDTVLVAKWTRHFNLNADGDWATLATLVSANDATSEELRNGNIYLKSNISLVNPDTLFSADKPFAGKFSGKNDIGGVISSNTISVTFDTAPATRSIFALFGAISGTAEHVDIDLTSNLNISGTDSYYVAGLTAQSTGTIKNVNINCAAAITAQTASRLTMGGIVAYNKGEIDEITAEDVAITVTANNAYVGGIVGYDEKGTISNVSLEKAALTLVSNEDGFIRAGGVLGAGKSTNLHDIKYIVQSNKTMNCTASDVAYVGGLVGVLDNASLQRSCVDGSTHQLSIDVSGKTAYAGGLVGYNKGVVINCYALDVAVNATADEMGAAGGLVGYNFNPNGKGATELGKITDSYAAAASATVKVSANTTAATSKVFAGGLFGNSNAVVTASRCFAYIPVYADITAGGSANVGYVTGSSVDSDFNMVCADLSAQTITVKDGEGEHAYSYNGTNTFEAVLLDITNTNNVDFKGTTNPASLNTGDTYWTLEDGKYPVLKED